VDRLERANGMRDRSVEAREIERSGTAHVLIPGAFMASKLVTCPESAHLEQIDYEDHPLGLLITACSRFQPACAVTCQRTCAAMLDRRNRLERGFEDEEEDTKVDLASALFLRWQS
jgi:hypothetical protein